MSIGVVRSAGPETGVTVSIVRDPALVRTVRLIAAAFARRAGQDEQLVEEIRLAVGEACALLVGGDRGGEGPSDPVVVAMSVDGRLLVRVRSTGPVAAEHGADSPTHVEPWALLRGLLDDFSVERDGGSTTVSMSWALS